MCKLAVGLKSHDPFVVEAGMEDTVQGSVLFELVESQMAASSINIPFLFDPCRFNAGISIFEDQEAMKNAGVKMEGRVMIPLAD